MESQDKSRQGLPDSFGCCSLRALRQGGMFSVLRLAALLNILALLLICAFILYNGLPVISWECW